MNPVFLWVLFTLSLFLGTLLMIEVGYRIGARQKVRYGGQKPTGFGVLEAALFGLMALILAFSFSGAGTRFDTRRQLITEEANGIGTAYLRLDLLPPQMQPELREKFRQYLDARLAAYAAFPEMTKVQALLARSAVIQGELWTKAVAATKEVGLPQVSTLLLPALNEMFDIANTRYLAGKIHPSNIVYVLMFILMLICSLLAGFEMGFDKARSWIHILAFTTLLAVTVYATIDLEFPRLGLIQVTDFDQAIIDVRSSMK